MISTSCPRAEENPSQWSGGDSAPGSLSLQLRARSLAPLVKARGFGMTVVVQASGIYNRDRQGVPILHHNGRQVAHSSPVLA